jgi:hypothetical protein
MTKFKPGKHRTRDGREVEVYRVDGVGSLPLIGALKSEGKWSPETWTLEGKLLLGEERPGDLMPPTPKASGFVNVYEDGHTSWAAHVDRADADDFARNRSLANKRIACIDLSQIDLTPFLVEGEE